MKAEYFIRIKDNKFILYSHGCTDKELENPVVTKENLKKAIKEVLQIQTKPIKVRDLIYYSLSLLSGYPTKKACRLVTDQEACDPLYQELVEFVLSLEKYQEIIKSSRGLKVIKDAFVISDINGIVETIPNSKVDFICMKDEFEKIQANLKRCSKTDILRKVLLAHFEVSDCKITYYNPIVRFFIHAEVKKELVFQYGQICEKIDNEIFPSKISTEDLKKAIIEYVESDCSINIKNIVFSSLEILSGDKVLRRVPTYITKYVGENKLKKDVLVEDPLYIELANFVESLPKYQENLKKQMHVSKIRNDSNREGRYNEKELRFVDRNYAFYGTYIPKHTNSSNYN